MPNWWGGDGEAGRSGFGSRSRWLCRNPTNRRGRQHRSIQAHINVSIHGDKRGVEAPRKEAISVHVSVTGSNFHRSLSALAVTAQTHPPHRSRCQRWCSLGLAGEVLKRRPRVAVGVVLVDVVAVPVRGLACEVALTPQGKSCGHSRIRWEAKEVQVWAWRRRRANKEEEQANRGAKVGGLSVGTTARTTCWLSMVATTSPASRGAIARGACAGYDPSQPSGERVAGAFKKSVLEKYVDRWVRWTS